MAASTENCKEFQLLQFREIVIVKTIIKFRQQRCYLSLLTPLSLSQFILSFSPSVPLSLTTSIINTITFLVHFPANVGYLHLRPAALNLFCCPAENNWTSELPVVKFSPSSRIVVVVLFVVSNIIVWQWHIKLCMNVCTYCWEVFEGTLRYAMESGWGKSLAGQFLLKNYTERQN